jgi:long-chain acyl-CoA synthetase
VAVPLPHGPKSDRLGAALADCSPSVCVVNAATARSKEIFADVPSVLVDYGRRVTKPQVSEHGFGDLRAALSAASDEPFEAARIDQDLAAIIYTSGSTGDPRGVMLRHANIAANTRSIVSYLGLTSRDRVMCVLPLYYVYGLSLLHTHMCVGGSIVLDNRFAYPNVVLTAMRERRVTGFAGVPSTFALLLHLENLHEYELPDLRYVTQAGGGMPPARILEWLERGPKTDFFVMYGATEASARLTYLPPSELRRKLGSIGVAIPNTEIIIVKDDGSIAAAGETGELVARGANISSGYWNNPQETSERFGPLGYRTGDLGYFDSDGFLYLVGRRHDMIKVGAQRVGAKEIEDVLNEYPGLSEVAVVAAPHDVLGEVPIAFVSMRHEPWPAQEELRGFCGARLAVHKVPARIVFCTELPKSGAGKIDRVSLRAQVATSGAAAQNV